MQPTPLPRLPSTPALTMNDVPGAFGMFTSNFNLFLIIVIVSTVIAFMIAATAYSVMVSKGE